MSIANQLNIFKEPLEICSLKPLTGFNRDGCCGSVKSDFGEHQICSVISEEFLSFSKKKGNDLITPIPEIGFDGLKAGQRWCLCISRWIEALKNDVAPKIILRSTSINVLKKVEIDILKKFAIDTN